MTSAMKMVWLIAASSVAQTLACETNLDAYVSAIMIFGILGGVFSIIVIILASLPLCCGVMKGAAKAIAGVAIAVGIVCCILPALGGPVMAGSATTSICDACEATYGTGCTDDEKQAIQEGLSGLGVIIGYTAGFGWLALICGITAAALGCCICCKCCKMKDEESGAAGGAPAVIGQPVG